MTINGKEAEQVIPEWDSRDCAARKRHYERMAVTQVVAEVGQRILAGSITGNVIEIDEITVNEYENDTEFPSDGFDVKFN